MKRLSFTKSKISEADAGNLLVDFPRRSSLDMITDSLSSLKSLGSMSDAKRAAQGFVDVREGGGKNATWDLPMPQAGTKTLNKEALFGCRKKAEAEESNIAACTLRDEIAPKTARRRGSSFSHSDTKSRPFTDVRATKHLNSNDLEELSQIEGAFLLSVKVD